MWAVIVEKPWPRELFISIFYLYFLVLVGSPTGLPLATSFINIIGGSSSEAGKKRKNRKGSTWMISKAKQLRFRVVMRRAVPSVKAPALALR